MGKILMTQFIEIIFLGYLAWLCYWYFTLLCDWYHWLCYWYHNY